MQNGTQSDAMNPWGIALFRTLRTIDPRTAPEQAAYAKWLDQRLDREAARAARIHGAAGVIPAPLWLVLFVIAVLIVGFMMFFADSGERADRPGGAGRHGRRDDDLDPARHRLSRQPLPARARKPPAGRDETELQLLDQERRILGDSTPIPCDERGRRTI